MMEKMQTREYIVPKVMIVKIKTQFSLLTGSIEGQGVQNYEQEELEY